MNQPKVWAWLGRFSYRLLGWMARLHLRHSRRSYLLLESSDEVLLTKNWFGRQEWHLPGGGIKQGEDAKAAACREAAEELSLSVESAELSLLSSGQWQSGGKYFDYQIFCVSLLAKPRLELKKPAILEARWVGLKPASQLDIPPEISHALESLANRDGRSSNLVK